MDPECRTYIQVALKFSSVWSELVGLSKTKGGKVLTPLTRCKKGDGEVCILTRVNDGIFRNRNLTWKMVNPHNFILQSQVYFFIAKN